MMNAPVDIGDLYPEWLRMMIHEAEDRDSGGCPHDGDHALCEVTAERYVSTRTGGLFTQLLASMQGAAEQADRWVRHQVGDHGVILAMAQRFHRDDFGQEARWDDLDMDAKGAYIDAARNIFNEAHT